jgi:hypothetical protein
MMIYKVNVLDAKTGIVGRLVGFTMKKAII